jgi:hypothetical protein
MGTQSSPPPEEGLAGSIRLCEAGGDKTVNGTMVKVRGIYASFYTSCLSVQLLMVKLLLYTRKNKRDEVR